MNTVMTMKTITMGLLAVIFVGLASAPATAQSRKELNLARKMLTELQPLSFKKNREYCGWIAKDKAGRLRVSKIFRGTRARCTSSIDGLGDDTLVASFHTHAGYSKKYDGEIPSVIDFESEKHFGTFGYVATPGGRFWVIDGKKGIVKLVCGPGCLPVDPKFQEKPNDRLRKQFNEEQLYSRVGRGKLKLELCDGSLCTD